MIEKSESFQEEYVDTDEQFISPTQRRQSKRRAINRRKSNPDFLTNEEIRNLRKVEPAQIILLRMDHRRNENRRMSKPKLLSINEIKILRQTIK